MATRLQFSQKFSRKMSTIGIIIGIFIGFMTPITYSIMEWRDFTQMSSRHAETIARKAGIIALDTPDLWYYNVIKFIELVDEEDCYTNIKSIKAYDLSLNLKFDYAVNETIKFSHSFRVPVIYGKEAYGYIEVERNIQPLLMTSSALLVFFVVLGISIGTFLYRFPVNMIRMMEKDVQNHVTQTKKQTELEIARLDRLSLIGQMATAIGHEIRNPLTTVKGYLQLFSQKTIFSSYAPQFNLMLDELSRANCIITEFLSLSHDKAIKMLPCSLNDMINNFQPIIESEALFHGMSLHMELKNTPNLLLDEKEIKQLILNLTRNSFEAMEKGGCLSIKTYLLSSYVVLAISDQGKGIAPELLSKLGTPFFTTKEGNAGLGLAICYSIAHRHKAKIDFISGKDGTTCSIYFPKIF